MFLPKINVGKASLLPNNLEVWALTNVQQLKTKSISGRERFKLEDANRHVKENEGRL